jgi:uncharacterized protein YfaS (alpha-2-macroglobulin family)
MRRDQFVATLGAVAIAVIVGFFAGRADLSLRQPLAPAPTVAEVPAAPRVARQPEAAPESPQRMAFRRVVPKPEAASPEVCLQFTKPLATSGPASPADFLTFEPALKPAARVEGDQICLGGLSPAISYGVTIGAGLLAADGDTLTVAESVPVSLYRFTAAVEFAEVGYILPREDAIGVPVRSRNLDRVNLRLIRIADRSLRAGIVGNRALGERRLSTWSRRTLEREQGIVVWDGSVAVENRVNEMVTTSVPVADMLTDRRPALYALIASATPLTSATGDDDYDSDSVDAQVQWVLLTDMAVTSLQAADATHVFVRALDTGKPRAGVAVDLVARNNDRLERATTDADGHVAFAAALLRGQGAAQAVALYVYGPGDDFTLHPLDRPAFDLSDRGVEGRKPPGRFDAFLYSDRGIYRPGETIHANLLLRGGASLDAIADAGVTLRLKRPNGVEFRRVAMPAQALGGFHTSFELPPDASRGQWTVEALVDLASPPVSSLAVDVQDFVPQRLKVEASAPDATLRAGDEVEIKVDAAFLYGAPAADARADVRLRLMPDEAPFPALKGWRFGRHDDKFVDAEVELEAAPTDAAGRTAGKGRIPTDITSSRPIRAVARADVFEPGGRPVGAEAPVRVRLRDLILGIRPVFEGDRAPVDTPIALEIAAFDAGGAFVARPQLGWKLVAERSEYFWYRSEGSWRYRRSIRDVPVASGTTALGTAPWRLTQTLGWGTYRLEVAEAGAAASYRFYVGWRGESGAETPDRAEVAADKPTYAAGETAKINIRPPFAGEVSVVVAGDRVHAWRTLSVPAEGATIDVPVGADWGVGAYVLVTAYRPLATSGARDSKRAVGLVHLGVETADRRMPVRIEAADVVRPSGPLSVKLSVEGYRPGDKAIVTLAAVDEGILQLTRFETPKPERQLLGKRRLGVDMRDDYGSLIDGLAAAAGALRQGGDSLGGVGLPVVPTRTVALFSGPVEIGADGSTTVAFDVPDFAGQLRLMAVGYAGRRFGHGEAKVVVREPLVAEAYLPRFLAPGDGAEMTVSLHNVEGTAGAYRVTVTAEGAIALEGAAERTVTLDAGQRQQSALRLTAKQEAGIGTVTLAVAAPGGSVRERQWQIAVRSPFRPMTLALAGQQPAGESFTLDSRWMQPFVPGSVRLSVNYSAISGLDVAGMVQALDRYPFGCTEQVASGAMPLLLSLDFDSVLGAGASGAELRKRLQQAVDRLVDRQSSDGDIGLWRLGDGLSASWTVVNAVDLLTLASARNYVVPPAALAFGKAYLRQQVASLRYERAMRPASVYAAYVLARSREIDAAALRQHYARAMNRTGGLGVGPLAMYGAALFHAGDTALANAVFAEVDARTSRPLASVSFAEDMYFGGAAIDVGIAAAMAAEARSATAAAALMPLLARVAPKPADATTQELAWMVRATAAVQAATPMTIAEAGVPSTPRPAPLGFRPGAERVAAGDYTLANRGDHTVFRTMVIHGEPRAAPPALNGGVALSKSFRTLKGEEIDPAETRQHDRLMVVVDAAVRRTVRGTRDFVLVDMLLAGWEIEAIVPPPENEDAGDGKSKPRPMPYPWLGTITRTSVAEARDDRLVAVIRVGGDGRGDARMRVAYVVRATTPGSYVLPGATMEDMYRPQVMGVTASGTTRVVGR